MLGSPATLIGYASLGVLSGGVAWWWRGNPLVLDPPWLPLEPELAHPFSALLGITFGLLTVSLSAKAVSKSPIIADLAAELKPQTEGLSPKSILGLAILSALGEEFLFRSLLQPIVGVFGQAVVFGLLHQVPGKARFAYAGWAAVVGLTLGSIFALTGSLVGPLLAHAIINALNLRFLQHHETIRNPGGLGGILGPPYPR